jgi:NADH-quinone oxidoreductase subunit N
LPPLLIVLFCCATLLSEASSRFIGKRAWITSFNLVGQAFIAYAFAQQWKLLRATGREGFEALQNAVTIDALGLFTNVVVWIAIVVLLLISYRYLNLSGEHHGEYYGLALLAQCGMYFMATGADLIVLFLGIELTAIAFYILVGFTRAESKSTEAALKYFLLSALSSGFVLYGFSLWYGISGSTAIGSTGSCTTDPAFCRLNAFAAISVTIGLLFKIGAAPFHAWAPDAYDGSPTPVTAYLSIASKIAAFSVIIRLFYTPALGMDVTKSLLTAAAVLSLTIGSIAALTQDRVKRLFAYSAISHAGYVLLGFTAGTSFGVAGNYIDLLIYALSNLGAFALLTSLRRRGIAGETIADLRGLYKTHPVHSAFFAVILLSLAGIPPTAGFIAKYYILAALVSTGHIALAVLAGAYVIVSLYFYFRLVREMYLSPKGTPQPFAISAGVQLALSGAALFTVVIGIFPEPVIRFATPLAEATLAGGMH